jgi:hypothetical protein
MRTKILLVLAVCLVLPVQDRSAPAQEAAAIEPAPGLWKYSEFDASTNTCKSDQVVSNGDGTFLLAKNADGTVKIHPGDGSDAFDCTVNGAAFECPDRAALSYDLRQTGFDAVLTGKALAKGRFTDASHMTGEQVATFSCSGSACPLAAMALGTSFPCEVKIQFEAKLKSAK